MRIPSPDPTGNGSYMHFLNGYRPAYSPPQLSPRPLAPLDRLDQVYRYLLGCLGLYDGHLDNLLARGLSPEAIARNGYRSLLMDGRQEIVDKVVKAVGAPEGVPGFYLQGGVRWRLAGWSGMVIPVRDLNGLIQGCQIQLNEPGKIGKYAWLSSHKQGGWSPGAPAHVVRPAEVTDQSVWITEGPLKADVAAEKLGAVMIGVAGAANWRSALGPVWYLLCYENDQQVVIAFDQDEDPKKVKIIDNYRVKLAEQIREGGMKAYRARWDSGKGIDDAKAAGSKVEILSMEVDLI